MVLKSLQRVLLTVLRPLGPTSNIGSTIQIAFSVGAPFAGLIPFALLSDWTFAKAALLALAVLLTLSLRGAYQLQADNEALLGQTPLQQVITAQISEGSELLRRLKRRRKSGGELPRPLLADIMSWTQRTNRDINGIAPEVASALFEAPMRGLGASRYAEDQINYVKSLLGVLRKLGRELRGSD